MIKIENVDVFGWDAAIRGMRNPLNSWNKSDSGKCVGDCADCVDYYHAVPEKCACFLDVNADYRFGVNDLKLAKSLVEAGSDHAKFLRMIHVQMDVVAPLYWWKEADQYKVGTTTNSCSTMHKIAAKEFTLDDFSHEHLICKLIDDNRESFIYGEIDEPYSPSDVMEITINSINKNREAFLRTKDKRYWWQMIQLLPSSYNQRRTWDLNYQVLRNIYHSRQNHKLNEWVDFCSWIELLPYAELIICGERFEKTGADEE